MSNVIKIVKSAKNIYDNVIRQLQNAHDDQFTSESSNVQTSLLMNHSASSSHRFRGYETLSREDGHLEFVFVIKFIGLS